MNNNLTTTIAFGDCVVTCGVSFGESLLAGTTRGAFVITFDRDHLEKHVANESIANYGVTALLIDKKKSPWIGAAGAGLIHLSPSLKEVRHFGFEDGVVYSDFVGVRHVASGDRVVMATNHGLLAFSTESTPAPQFNPRVQIVSFRVNGDERDIGRATTTPLELAWHQNNIEIGFSSLSFIHRDELSFSYRLDGLDTLWRPAMAGQVLAYTHLPAGAYTFRVRCMVPGAAIVSDEATASFVVIKPFWQTWWFGTSVVGVVAVMIFAIVKRREVRRRRIRQIKERISRDLHDHIGSSLSAINIMLTVVNASFREKPDKAGEFLRRILIEAHLTQENLHDIVWSMGRDNSTMYELTDRMREFMQSIFEGQQTVTKLQLEEGFEQVTLSLEKRYNLYLLFKEIVNNGAKYAGASQVNVLIRKTGQQLCLLYEDDGKGFDLSRGSTGNGLKNLRKRAEAAGGSIDIDSKIGAGTKIRLFLPF